MRWLRMAVAIFVAIHGLAHLTWLIGAWFPSAELVGPEPWLLSDGVTITSPAGRVLASLSLLVVIGFLAVAVGMLTDATWWAPLLLSCAALSVLIVLPWWEVSPGTTALNALLANLGLVAVTVVPAARQFVRLS